MHWQDLHVEIEKGEVSITNIIINYEREARRMLEDGSLLFPREPVDPGDARMVIHPPGYSMLMRFIYGDSAPVNARPRLKWLQVVCDASAAVVVFFIALELMPLAAAVIAALLVALSPHLAFYSLWLSPDSPAVLPILMAVYLVIKASRSARLMTAVLIGALMGLSCWLRSNALLLAPFLAVATLPVIERGKRLRYAAAIIGAMLMIISPLTIRNWVMYLHFIPVSIGSGITMVEGIADYDAGNRFGMPADDKETALKDAEWHNRPDYAGNLWTPDGVERDRARFSRGFAVVRSNPVWFISVMIRRAAFMLRYNDSGPSRWPLGTSQVPTVSREPGFGSSLGIAPEDDPVWSYEAVDLLDRGEVIAPGAVLSLDDGKRLLISGDDSAFGDQFASAPVSVKKNTDYVLRLLVRLDQGQMAAKVTDARRRIALASTIIEKKKKKKKALESSPGNEPELNRIDLPFASGDRSDVRLTLSNNSQSFGRPRAHIAGAELFEIGPTPHQQTRLVRPLVRGLQKNLFTTSRMTPLVILGIVLIALTRRWRAMLILLAVPAYYLCFQSMLHTEYRYILAIHYFLFIFAAASLYSLGAAAGQGAIRLWRRREPVL